MFTKIIKEMKNTILGKYYYWIWTDGIKRMQERHPNSPFYWKFMLMLGMVVSPGICSMIIYGFIGGFFGLPLTLNIPNEFWNTLLSGIIYFYLPWFILHFYLVFWKNKYKSFIDKYPSRNGKLFINFFLSITFIPMFFVIILIVIAKMFAN